MANQLTMNPYAPPKANVDVSSYVTTVGSVPTFQHLVGASAHAHYSWYLSNILALHTYQDFEPHPPFRGDSHRSGVRSGWTAGGEYRCRSIAGHLSRRFGRERNIKNHRADLQHRHPGLGVHAAQPAE